MIAATDPADALPRVLFVDGEQRVLNSLRLMFRHKFELFLAADARTACKILDGQVIDVIVAAERVTDSSGIAVLAAARESSPTTARILLTERDDPGAFDEDIRRTGIFRVLPKPSAPGQIRLAIELAIQSTRNDPQTPTPGVNSLKKLVDEILTVAPQAGSLDADVGFGSGPGDAIEHELAAADRMANAAILAVEAHRAGRSAPDVAANGVVVFSADTKLIRSVEKGAAGRFPVFVASNIVRLVRFLDIHEIGVLITDIAHDCETIEAMTSRLKDYRPELVTIVVADEPEPSRRARLMSAGCVFRFLSKPTSPGRCAVALQAALQHVQVLRNEFELEPSATDDIGSDANGISGVFERIKSVKRLWA